MALHEAIIDRYETEVAVDWYEVLAIHHSEFSPSLEPTADTYYIHNGINVSSESLPIDGGNQTFHPAPFEVSLPTRDGEGKGDLIITFSFPQTLISEELEKALANPLEAIEVRYNLFIYKIPSIAMYDPWMQFYMTEVSTNENSVTATCRMSDLVNRTFPHGVYRGMNFPGLIRR